MVAKLVRVATVDRVVVTWVAGGAAGLAKVAKVESMKRGLSLKRWSGWKGQQGW